MPNPKAAELCQSSKSERGRWVREQQLAAADSCLPTGCVQAAARIPQSIVQRAQVPDTTAKAREDVYEGLH
jgi:hypothetical protein